MARALAVAIGAPVHVVDRHRFPDGELRLRLPRQLPADVVVFRSLYQPNEKLVELAITAPTARELGASRLTLVCPYLAYMRQDAAFVPGEAVSQRHVAALLAAGFNRLVTVDPHLHRTHSLAALMPGCDARPLSAAPAIGAWIARHVPAPLLLGPDAESAAWVKAAASACGPAAQPAWCRKERRGDRDVRVELPQGWDCSGRAVVLIDDMASTGRTLAAAARLALAAGAASVDVAVTHALFVADAVDVLRAVGVREVWSTDTVPHPTNAISVAPLLAEALNRS